ncbi:MAG: ferritin-like domain-containing protein [Armatimonadota bacterium]
MSEMLENSAASATRGTSGEGSALRNVMIAAAGVAAVTAVFKPREARAITPALTFSQIPGTGDIKVLNYALALEALEANLYVQALQRLTTGGTNGLGRQIPGLGLSANELDVKYLTEFAKVEAEHRDFLNGALGSASIIGTGTNGILRNAQFDFGLEDPTKNSRQQVLELIYTVEATGTQAYLGAIPSFATKTYLSAAAGIQGTEARHTAVVAIIFNLLGFTPRKDTAPLVGQTTNILGSPNTAGIDGTLSPDEVLAAVSPIIVLPAVE